MLTLPYDITAGYFDSGNENRFDGLTVSAKRTVRRYEIELYLEDGMTTCTDGQEYNIRKWNIQITKPGQIRYSHLPFKALFAKFRVEGELADRFDATPQFFMSSHPEQTHKYLDELVILCERRENELLIYSRLLALMDLVLYDAGIPESHGGTNYQLIKTAKQYIETNLANPIHLEDIASAVNLSPIYFHNVFSNACGQSPHEYLIKCRIDKAKKQLWNPAITIAEISENCGFGSQQYFTKIFKKETGSSPGKYRKTFFRSYFE